MNEIVLDVLKWKTKWNYELYNIYFEGKMYNPSKKNLGHGKAELCLDEW